MKYPYIIAEAAQGFEGSCVISKLLVRAAAKAHADAIKFQLVFADDLAEPGYEYYELFKSLEMSEAEWLDIRRTAQNLGVDFIIDVFGPQSLQLARKISPDGIKIHSTCFFDDEFIRNVIDFDAAIYLSSGGIEPEEVQECLKKYKFHERDNFTLMFGYQAEPTPIENNNLARITEVKSRLNIHRIGFMDHSDGDGPHTHTLSALALGLGVSVFEKHITLDRTLEMEDYVSALSPSAFSSYVRQIKDLCLALGSSSLDLTDAEKKYRNRAIKRVVAKENLERGIVLTKERIKLSRSADMLGSFKIEDVIGKTLKNSVSKGNGIEKEMVA